MIAAPLHQITIWEALEDRSAGRPTRRPWGCPLGVWRAACKRVERKQVSNPIDALPAIAVGSLRRPWPISIGRARQEARKIVIRAASDCTGGFRHLVQAGRMPGMSWEEGVGVIRWIR